MPSTTAAAVRVLSSPAFTPLPTLSISIHTHNPSRQDKARLLVPTTLMDGAPASPPRQGWRDASPPAPARSRGPVPQYLGRLL